MALRHFAIVNKYGEPTGDIIKRKTAPRNLNFYEIPVSIARKIDTVVNLDFTQPVANETTRAISLEIILCGGESSKKLVRTSTSVAQMRSVLETLGTFQDKGSSGNFLVGHFTLNPELFVTDCEFPKLAFTTYNS